MTTSAQKMNSAEVTSLRSSAKTTGVSCMNLRQNSPIEKKNATWTKFHEVIEKLNEHVRNHEQHRIKKSARTPESYSSVYDLGFPRREADKLHGLYCDWKKSQQQEPSKKKKVEEPSSVEA